MIELGGARRPGPAGQEVVRLWVVAALESGQVRTYRQATEVFGVSERSVGTWWRTLKAAGAESLGAPVKSRSGPGELIGAEDRAALFRAMADCTPEQLLIGGAMWTRSLVAELIRMVIGVTMTEQGVGKRLRRYGFSPQRPARRSYRRQPDRVTAWLEEEYPAIAERAKAERAVVAWADQCGMRSDTAPPGCSWAPAGQTPTVQVDGRRFRVDIMSAVASRGALWFTAFTGKSTAKVFTVFLDPLGRQAGRKVHVIADRHPVHHSKARPHRSAPGSACFVVLLRTAALPHCAPQRFPSVDLYSRKSRYAPSCPYRHDRHACGRPCAAQPGDHP
ncbi:IS630 family transposase [Streptomyces sp. NPDC050485]|uniref:IS630 family transposase n=1 Tax=Streptomyces sp. NPDC050485 TaxID=3365617 RepID=UPI0037B39160